MPAFSLCSFVSSVVKDPITGDHGVLPEKASYFHVILAPTRDIVFDTFRHKTAKIFDGGMS